MPDRSQIGLTWPFSVRQVIDELRQDVMSIRVLFLLGDHRLRRIRQLAGVDFQTTIQNQQSQNSAEQDQQRSLDELHVGGAHHAGRGDDQRHDHTDQDDTGPVGKAEQRLDQGSRPHHLRNQVEDADDQRADPRRQGDRARLKLAVQRVGKRVLAESLQRLCDDKQRDDPARQKADRVQEPVIAVERDHPADAEE